MMLSRVRTEKMSPELSNLVMQVRLFTAGGYDMYDQNKDTIIRLLDKILALAKKENEWYLYFDALYWMLYILSRGENHKKILKYAEIYYKDRALYMDREIPNYPGTDMAETNTYCYTTIFGAYFGYYQISDEKMEAFMKIYEETVRKYGGQVYYYKDEMTLAGLYRDKERLRQAKNHFEKYEVESCYVCMHLQYFRYYFLNHDMEAAEELLETILQKRIPKKHQWCYERCQNTKAQTLCCCVLEKCLSIGDSESFRHIYKKYWSSVAKRLGPEDGRSYIGISIFCCAVARDFSGLEWDLRNAKETAETIDKSSTHTTIHKCLRWWIYFLLLEKSGTKEISLALPDRGNKLPTREAAKFFEEKADKYGKLFAAARKQYDYELIKSAYWECAGL